MKRILLILAVGFFIVISPTYSQGTDSIGIQNQNSNYYKNYLGINAGVTTGVGFSYRYWPKKSGVQITILPLYDKNDFYLSFGLTYLNEIKTYKYSRFLFFVSNHITNFIGDLSYIDNLGIGLGMDFNFMEHVKLNFMLGYAAIDIFDDFKTRPTIEFGAFYNF